LIFELELVISASICGFGVQLGRHVTSNGADRRGKSVNSGATRSS
jgi:hypothetical protein